MSRIFAAVAVGTVLLIGSAAMGSALDNSDVNSSVLDGIVEMFSTGFELGGLLVPLALLVGLLLATAGVFARV